MLISLFLDVEMSFFLILPECLLEFLNPLICFNSIRKHKKVCLETELQYFEILDVKRLKIVYSVSMFYKWIDAHALDCIH